MTLQTIDAFANVDQTDIQNGKDKKALKTVDNGADFGQSSLKKLWRQRKVHRKLTVYYNCWICLFLFALK